MRRPTMLWLLPFTACALGLFFAANRAAAVDSGGDWMDLFEVIQNGAASQPTSTSQPASQASTEPATQPAAEASWPPGLMMDGLDKIGAKKPLDDLGLRVYGVEEAGFTGNLTNGQRVLFGRVFDAFRPDNVQNNQTRLIIERPYDATKNFDFGGRFEMMYGSDARITKNTFPGSTEYAIPEHVGGGVGADWLDFLQAYGQLWFKTGKDSGLEVTAGKWVTTMGYEVIAAEGNPLYSHSYLFGYAIPFTNTGVKLNYVWNAQLSTYFAVVNGWDDFADNNDDVSYMAGAAWSGAEQIGGHARDQVYFNAITGPEQTGVTGNQRTVIDATVTHWWTEKLSSTLNGDWGTEQGAGARGGEANWYGLAHYLTYVFNDYVSGTWRTEWFADDSGSRIGQEGNFFENTFGLNLTPWPTHKVLKNLSIRPEIRWDHSDRPVFGGAHDEMTIGFDMIFKF